MIERTADAFSRFDFSAWLDEFHAPRIVMLPDGAVSPADGAEVERLLAHAIESLRARGYANQSSIKMPTVERYCR